MYKDLRLFISKKTDEILILREQYGEDFMTDSEAIKELSSSSRKDDSGSEASLSKIDAMGEQRTHKEDEERL